MGVSGDYEFGEVFQLRLLSYLIRDPEPIYDLVEPQYFTSAIFVEISRVVKEALKNDRSAQLHRHTLIELLRHSVGDQESWSVYKSTVKRIYKLELGDKPILYNQALAFARDSRYREVLEACELDVTHKHFERVHERMEQLRTFMNGTGGGAVVEWDSLPHPLDFPVREIDWTIEGILPTDAVIVVSGDEGTGKTLQMLNWSRAITEGTEFLGRQAYPRKVLYLGLDVSRTNLDTYLKMMRWTPDEDFRFMSFWTGDANQPPMLDKPEDVARLLGLAERYKPVIIFDTVRDFYEGEENSSTDTKPIMDVARKARSVGATPILLAHPPKSGGSLIRGTGLVSQKVDIPYLVSKERRHGKEYSVLTCPKKNRFGSTQFTLAMEMQFIPVPGRAPFFRLRERPDWKSGEKPKREGEMEALVAYLRDHPGSTQKQIEVALHMGDRKVKELVGIGEGAGDLQREKGRGKTWKWSVADDTRGKVIDFDAVEIAP